MHTDISTHNKLQPLMVQGNCARPIGFRRDAEDMSSLAGRTLQLSIFMQTGESIWLTRLHVP